MEHKDVTTMSVEEIETEIESIKKMDRKLIDFSVVSRAESLSDELMYQKIYKPKGYSRFDAGFLSSFI